MIIGIDTFHNKQYSCVVFAGENELNVLYLNLCKELKIKCNSYPPFHWRKVPASLRHCFYKNSLKLLKETRIKFFIVEHKREDKVAKANYYLKEIPNKYAFILERLLGNTFGVLNIECDEDFEIKSNQSRTTISFLKHFMNSVSLRLTVKPAVINEAKSGFVYTDIIHKGKLLRINAGVVSSNNSKAIQIADLILGMYNYDREKVKEIIKFEKI